MHRSTLLAVVTALACPALSAAGQAARPAESAHRWEVEGHGGWFGASDVTSGTPIDGFPTGATISSFIGISSRAVSSWYFGDGPVLINAAYSQSGRSARITPLDNVLKAPVARREGGGSVGFRASRQLTARFSAEFNFDHVSSSLALADGVEDALQATRGSFASVFFQLFPTGEIASVLTVDRGGNYSQQFVTGAVNFQIGTFGHVAPYATAGLGSVFNHGDTPAATLVGNYGASPIPQVVWDETDTVTVRAVPKDHALVAVFGGGARFPISPRQGIRADLRLHLSDNLIDTTVDASPSRGPGGTTNAIFILATNPAVQVSSGPSATIPSSLSGPAVRGLETFNASGTQMQLSFSVGYFFRF